MSKDYSLLLQADNVNDFYRDMIDSLLERGLEISPRGLLTKEIRPVTVILNKPRERFLTCPGRNIHPFFQCLESIWILAGHGNVDFISYYLKNIEKYSDNRSEFHAPYGIRMRRSNSHRDEQFPIHVRDQFFDCLNVLNKDLSSRQAVMTFWDPAFDHFQMVTNDRPCNFGFQFLYREGCLDFTIFNRSNDLSWGLCNANVVQFSVILEMMAMLLDVSVGKQIHMINSLHLYDYQGETIKKVLNASYSFNVYEHVEPLKFDMSFKSKNPLDRLMKLNSELHYFFISEDKIRNGEFVAQNERKITLNYLKDGLTLAKSYFCYKQKDYKSAAAKLFQLLADDIFVSAVEFIARKGDPIFIEELVRDRFEDIMKPESLNEVLNYIKMH